MIISLLNDYFHRCCMSPTTSNASRLALRYGSKTGESFKKSPCPRDKTPGRVHRFSFFPQPPVVNFPIALQSANSSPNPHVTRRWKSHSNGRQLNHEELHDATPETQASGKGGRPVFCFFFPPQVSTKALTALTLSSKEKENYLLWV